MEAARYGKRGAYLLAGGVGLVISVGYILLSLRLPFGQLDRPGAGVFPIFVGAILAVGSLATLWEGWFLDRRVTIEFPAGRDRWRVIGLVALLLGYFLALPWFGQIVSSIVFSAALMRLLSDLGRLRILVYSVLLAITVDLVFEVLLKVPLPEGVLGI